MKEVDVLKDIMQFKAALQASYNENVINIVNPEARQLFTQMRDDETRAIINLQQKITRLEYKPKIIARLLPTKSRF